MREQILWNLQTFFVCFCILREDTHYSQIKPQLEVEIEVGREAPWKHSKLKLDSFVQILFLELPNAYISPNIEDAYLYMDKFKPNG